MSDEYTVIDLHMGMTPNDVEKRLQGAADRGFGWVTSMQLQGATTTLVVMKREAEKGPRAGVRVSRGSSAG